MDIAPDPNPDASAQEPVSLPALLRGARNAFARVIRAALVGVECDDMPRNGVYMVVAIARYGAPLGQIIRDLSISKQAASQLVDTLVLRGYLERTTDPEDRRRMTLTATDRGKAAAAACRTVVDGLEAQLTAQVGAEALAITRKTLFCTIMLGEELHPA